MTRCVCFQPDRLSCRIEKVSAKDGEMDGRNTNRPVRYHGRIGFTSHERELLHWNLSATMLSCPWSIWDSFRCLYSNTPKRSFGWIAIKINYLKVPTYDREWEKVRRF